jgi:hypothetical protein
LPMRKYATHARTSVASLDAWQKSLDPAIY